MYKYNEVACFGTYLDTRRYITVAELWECQFNPSFRFSSIQLFLNPVKHFERYVYNISVVYLPSTNRRATTYQKNFINGTPHQEFQTEEIFWKVKTDRFNCKDSTLEEALLEEETPYKYLISTSLRQIINGIQRVSKQNIKSIKASYAIHKGKIFIIL